MDTSGVGESLTPLACFCLFLGGVAQELHRPVIDAVCSKKVLNNGAFPTFSWQNVLFQFWSGHR